VEGDADRATEETGGDVEADGGGGVDGGDRKGTVESLFASTAAGSCGFLVLSSGLLWCGFLPRYTTSFTEAIIDRPMSYCHSGP
jgi:hypothetical protein